MLWLSLFCIKYEALILLSCSTRQCVTCSLRLSAESGMTDFIYWGTRMAVILLGALLFIYEAHLLCAHLVQEKV